jgi:hypothetical protein
LIFFWVQIRRESANRREDRQHALRLQREGFETANTPILTVVVKDSTADAARGSATFALVILGSGVVRNVDIECWVGNVEPQHPLAAVGVPRGELPRLALVRTAAAVIAPGEVEFHKDWRTWHEPQPLTIRVTALGTFWQSVGFEQSGEIAPNGAPILNKQARLLPAPAAG